MKSQFYDYLSKTLSKYNSGQQKPGDFDIFQIFIANFQFQKYDIFGCNNDILGCIPIFAKIGSSRCTPCQQHKPQSKQCLHTTQLAYLDAISKTVKYIPLNEKQSSEKRRKTRFCGKDRRECEKIINGPKNLQKKYNACIS